jgi:hypothetical protein
MSQSGLDDSPPLLPCWTGPGLPWIKFKSTWPTGLPELSEICSRVFGRNSPCVALQQVAWVCVCRRLHVRCHVRQTDGVLTTEPRVDDHGMLCYVMLGYVMLSYVMFYVMLCYVKLCYVFMLCYVMLCYVVLCYITLCYVVLYCVMLCYVMLCYVMLCYVMLEKQGKEMAMYLDS